MRVLPLVLLGLLSGCASFEHGSAQNVTVVTPDVEGASCTLTDSKGLVSEIASTPGNTKVKRGNGPVSVICKKTGYTTGAGQLKEGISEAVYGNIFIPVGFLVDSLTGSGEGYVSTIDIDMEPVSTKAGSKPWE
jgi:hypothetical protein